jgi:putrescine aminotransferase
MDALAEAFTENTAAVLLEPIQGEAGVIVPPDDYLPRVRDLCTERGVLLLVDEVQTGFGRTGRLFAVDHYGVVPDVLILAKALGGGVLPIGAFMANAEVWQVMEANPLLHSTTFGGNPLACAAATAAVRAILEQNLPQRAAELGAYLLERLEAVRQRYPEHLREVRGRGLLIGVEFADSDVGGLVIAGLAQRRILAGYTLNNPKVIRFEPPLVITPEQLDHAVEAFTESLEQAVTIAATLE